MMAKRNGIFALLAIMLSIGYWANHAWMISEKPNDLLDLEDELIELNEQLISAQILANRVGDVYTLFEENLALSKQDSLADDASLPFMKNLMEMVNMSFLPELIKAGFGIGSRATSAHLLMETSLPHIGLQTTRGWERLPERGPS